MLPALKGSADVHSSHVQLQLDKHASVQLREEEAVLFPSSRLLSLLHSVVFSKEVVKILLPASFLLPSKHAVLLSESKMTPGVQQLLLG